LALVIRSLLFVLFLSWVTYYSIGRKTHVLTDTPPRRI
jgi:hypothetical protein